MRRLNQTAALTVFAACVAGLAAIVYAAAVYGAGRQHSGLMLCAALMQTALATMALSWVFQAFAPKGKQCNRRP